MKKVLTVLLSLISIICVACSFSACGDEEDKEINNTEKFKTCYLQTYVIKDYPNATVDDVSIKKYYGEYGTCQVAIIECGYFEYPQAIAQETIKDLVFTYADYNTVEVFDGTRLYTLKEAYLNSLLTLEDLQNLREKFPGEQVGAKELHGEAIK